MGLADNLSTLSTFNWGKLQLLNVDFFVYIKLSTFLCQKAVSPCISSLSYVFHKMRFSWNSFLSTLSTGFSTKAKTGTAQSFSTILPVIYQTAKQGSAQGEIRQISLHNHIISGFGSKAVLLADMTEVDAGPQPKYLSRKGTWSTWKLRPRRYSSSPASVGKSKVRR